LRAQLSPVGLVGVSLIPVCSCRVITSDDALIRVIWVIRVIRVVIRVRARRDSGARALLYV